MSTHMKYFGISSNDQDNNAEIARRRNDYYSYLDVVREKMPENLWHVAQHVNFGDHDVHELNADLSRSTVTVKVNGETSMRSPEQTYTLDFSGVTYFDIVNPLQVQNPLLSATAAFEVANHEVEVINSDDFEFRFVFHSQVEMRIRFKYFGYEITSDIETGNGTNILFEEMVSKAEEDARIGNLSEVRAMLPLATKLLGGHASSHYRLGNLALTIDDYNSALTQFLLALEIDADHIPSQFALAKLKYSTQNYADALFFLKKITTENPNHPGALLYYVRVLGAMEDWPMLVQLCTEPVQAVSGEVRLWYTLALASTNKIDEAKHVYKFISKAIRNRNSILNKRILSALSTQNLHLNGPLFGAM